jgi:hypothetical protein
MMGKAGEGTGVTRSETLTANARIKATATYFFNLSAALSGAIAARVWIVTRFDLTSLIWGAAAATLFAIGHRLLYLLEPESEQ